MVGPRGASTSAAVCGRDKMISNALDVIDRLKRNLDELRPLPYNVLARSLSE